MRDDETLDKALEAQLALLKASHCPSCGRKMDRGDCAWNSGSTVS